MDKSAAVRKPNVTNAPGPSPVPSEPPPADLDWRRFDPSMLQGEAALLAKELVTYRDHLQELLLHQGRFVVIKGQEILGIYRSRNAALKEAARRFGPAPVLVKKIVEREPIRDLGHADL